MYVLQQIFRILQNPHLIHITPWVSSVTVTLKPGFEVLTVDRIEVNNWERGFVKDLTDPAI